MSAFALFDTPIGRCALLWRGGLVTGAALPGPELHATIASRWPGAIGAEPPPEIAAVVDDVRRLLSGDKIDLADVAVELGGIEQFERHVLEATRRIPPGETRTYGDLAREIGTPGAARAVGRALGRNPIPIVIPCHRVLAASGSGGFSAPGGASTKMKMLEIEGARRAGELELFERLPWALPPAR
jgi:methylated-DNA-[protein]-cysteine S-methyltransferase